MSRSHPLMSPSAEPLSGSWRHAVTASLGVAAAVLVVVALAWGGVPPAHAAEATVGLGTASSYAVLAGSEVTNTGPSVISGDLGVSPGTAVSGFPPGIVTNGSTHAADAVALQAKDDLTTAYDDAAGRSTTTDVTGTDLGGQTLVSGVYAHSSGMQLTGTLTLDAQGDPDAVFIFKAASTLVTASGASVELINGASPCRVFWQVGSSATLGTGTQFVGTVMALTSASLQTGANVQGRILARNGAVTLDNNDITAPACGSAPTSTATSTLTATPTGSTGSTATATPSGSTGSTATVTATPSASPSTPQPNGGGGTGGSSGPSSPVIPSGHPHTGMTAGSGGSGPWLPLGFGALVAAAGAALALTRGMRTSRQH